MLNEYHTAWFIYNKSKYWTFFSFFLSNFSHFFFFVVKFVVSRGWGMFTLHCVFLFTFFLCLFNFEVCFGLCSSGVQCRDLTLSLPHPLTFPGWKVYAQNLQNSIFTGAVTNLPSVLCILMKSILMLMWKRKQKGLRISNFTLLILLVIEKWYGSERVNGSRIPGTEIKAPSAKNSTQSYQRFSHLSLL